MFLLNTCFDKALQQNIGVSHVRVGNDSTAFSVNNAQVKTGIVDGGIFSLSPLSGQFITLRRDGPNPEEDDVGDNPARYWINEIKVYECPSLF